MRSLPLGLVKQTTARPSEIVLQPQQATEAEAAWKPFAGLAKALVATALEEIYYEEIVHDIELDNLSDFDDDQSDAEGPEEVFDLVEEQEMHWLDVVLADVGFLDQADAVSVATSGVHAEESEPQNQEEAEVETDTSCIPPSLDEVAAAPQSHASDIFCTASRTFMLSEKPALGSDSGPEARRSSMARAAFGTPSNRHRRTIYGAVVRAAAPEELLTASGKAIAGRTSGLQSAFRMDVGDLASASFRESSLSKSYEALGADFHSLTGLGEDKLGSHTPADSRRSLSPAHLLRLSVRPGQRSAGLQPPSGFEPTQGSQQFAQKLKADLSPVQRPIRPQGCSSRPQSRSGRASAMQLDLGLPTSPALGACFASPSIAPPMPRKVASVPSLQAFNAMNLAGTKSNKLSISTGLLPPLKSDRSVKGATVEWTAWDVQAGRRRRGLVF